MLSSIFRFTQVPKKRGLYAIRDGFLKGASILFLHKDDKNYKGITFPDMEIHNVPIKDVEMGLKNKIIDLIKVIEKDVYTICVAEYNKRLSMKK